MSKTVTKRISVVKNRDSNHLASVKRNKATKANNNSKIFKVN